MIAKNNCGFVIRMNSNFYDAQTVREAFAELKNLVNADLEEGEYFIVKINDSEEAENCGYEFLNYVLKLMKNKGIV
jgi:hypothetical protein